MGREDVAAGKTKQTRGKINDIVGAVRGKTSQQIKGKAQKAAEAGKGGEPASTVPFPFPLYSSQWSSRPRPSRFFLRPRRCWPRPFRPHFSTQRRPAPATKSSTLGCPVLSNCQPTNPAPSNQRPLPQLHQPRASPRIPNWPLAD